MDELEESISAIEHLFKPDRYNSFKDEFEFIVKYARIGKGLASSWEDLPECTEVLDDH